MLELDPEPELGDAGKMRWNLKGFSGPLSSIRGTESAAAFFRLPRTIASAPVVEGDEAATEGLCALSKPAGKSSINACSGKGFDAACRVSGGPALFAHA